jgi:hypothetical protein
LPPRNPPDITWATVPNDQESQPSKPPNLGSFDAVRLPEP